MSAPLTPSEQLVRSRERLRQALRENGPAENATTNIGASPWSVLVKASPAAGLVVEILRARWQRHPWRVAVVVAGDAVKAAVQPLAQRHPLGLVLASLLAGGVLAWIRPWRLLLTPALVAAVLPQLLSKAAAQSTPRSWIDILSAIVREQTPPDQV